jgi:hypothetical protein
LLTRVDEALGSPGRFSMESARCRRYGFAMLQLHGCRINQHDADSLIDALTAEGSAPSLETAAAIRWGCIYGLTADTIEPDMQAAILNVTHGGTSIGLT